MKNQIVKTIVLVSVMGFMSHSSMAQSKESMTVSNAFSAKYPSAKLKEWKMKNDTCIAMFNMDKRHYQAYYTTDGTWIKTERNVKHLSTLPMPTQIYLKNSKYASWHIDNLAKVQTPMHNVYMVQLDNHSGNTSYENIGSDETENLYFNSKGDLVAANRQ